MCKMVPKMVLLLVLLTFVFQITDQHVLNRRAIRTKRVIYYPNPLPQDVLCGYFQNKCDCRGIRAHCVDQTCCNPHRIHVKKVKKTTQSQDNDDDDDE
uniref:BAPSP-6 n=1 Tax=Gigantidas platifrons TaxID=2830794 RepID=A0A124E9A9_9BIVA